MYELLDVLNRYSQLVSALSAVVSIAFSVFSIRRTRKEAAEE